MVEPKEVNTSKFTVGLVIFDKDGFSIAHGTWNDSGDKLLAMRWNGEEDDDSNKGYPSTFGHPQWFVLPTEIARIVLLGLIAKNENALAEIDILKEFMSAE